MITCTDDIFPLNKPIWSSCCPFTVCLFCCFNIQTRTAWAHPCACFSRWMQMLFTQTSFHEQKTTYFISSIHGQDENDCFRKENENPKSPVFKLVAPASKTVSVPSWLLGLRRSVARLSHSAQAVICKEGLMQTQQPPRAAPTSCIKTLINHVMLLYHLLPDQFCLINTSACRHDGWGTVEVVPAH